jgi:hypothetical protein
VTSHHPEENKGCGNDSVGANPNETLADFSSPLNDINDIMEWQDILNSMAREEAKERDQDVALLGNCDSEDEEDLEVAFTASHAEKEEAHGR